MRDLGEEGSDKKTFLLFKMALLRHFVTAAREITPKVKLKAQSLLVTNLCPQLGYRARFPCLAISVQDSIGHPDI